MVLKLRSVNNIVIAPANTGSDRRSKNAVINTDQTKSGNRCIVIPGPRILKMVVIKLIAPRILLAPERCKLNIARSTAPPEWLAIELNGGYHLC